MFEIIDDSHSELLKASFQTRQEAISELQRRSKIPWNKEPNRAPCNSWRTCGRRYMLEEYDQSGELLSRNLILSISAVGVHWEYDADKPVSSP